VYSVFAVQRVDPRRSFAGEPINELYPRLWEADPVQVVMQHVHDLMPVEMWRSHAKPKEGANRGCVPTQNIQVGSKVWLDARNVRTTRRTGNLDWKRLGPFRVQKQVSPYAYKLELPESIRIHRVQPVSLLDPVVDDPLDGHVVPAPLPVEVDGEEEYHVSGVEDSRVYRNQLQYLIQWTGYYSLTWQPAKFVDGIQVVEEFHQRYPRKPGPLEHVLGGPRA
jgi:hypothetical protein